MCAATQMLGVRHEDGTEFVVAVGSTVGRPKFTSYSKEKSRAFYPQQLAEALGQPEIILDISMRKLVDRQETTGDNSKSQWC